MRTLVLKLRSPTVCKKGVPSIIMSGFTVLKLGFEVEGASGERVGEEVNQQAMKCQYNGLGP